MLIPPCAHTDGAERRRRASDRAAILNFIETSKFRSDLSKRRTQLYETQFLRFAGYLKRCGWE
jgi:hypothetical protein